MKTKRNFLESQKSKNLTKNLKLRLTAYSCSKLTVQHLSIFPSVTLIFLVVTQITRNGKVSEQRPVSEKHTGTLFVNYWFHRLTGGNGIRNRQKKQCLLCYHHCTQQLQESTRVT